MRHGFDIPTALAGLAVMNRDFFYQQNQNTKPLSFIRAGTGKMPPRVLASGPKPCGGNKQLLLLLNALNACKFYNLDTILNFSDSQQRILLVNKRSLKSFRLWALAFRLFAATTLIEIAIYRCRQITLRSLVNY